MFAKLLVPLPHLSSKQVAALDTGTLASAHVTLNQVLLSIMND